MLQQFGSRKNVGAGSASDFLRAKRINAIRAAGDIKANTATSGYEPITIVQFNSVVQELNNLTSRPGEGARGAEGIVGISNVSAPALPTIGDNSFVFQVATGTAVFSFDTTAPALSDISWGGPGSLTTVVDGSQTTYQYTYSDGNQYHNVTMSNVSNVQEVSIYQTPRPAAPAFTISGVTSDALDTYTLHVSPVAGATSYFLALNGTPTSIIQPAVNLSYRVEGVCGRTYSNTLATMKQGRIGDFSAAQTYSIPALPKPTLTLEALTPISFTATVSSSIPAEKRFFELYQLSGGTYFRVGNNANPVFTLSGDVHSRQTIYANLIYNTKSTISSDFYSITLPNSLIWSYHAGASSNMLYSYLDLNPSTGTLIGVQSTVNDYSNIYRTTPLGEQLSIIDLPGFNTSEQFGKMVYGGNNTWITYTSNAGNYKLYRSTDDGQNWYATTFDNSQINTISNIDTDYSGNWVIAGYRGAGIVYSSNNGTTWASAEGDIPNKVDTVRNTFNFIEMSGNNAIYSNSITGNTLWKLINTTSQGIRTFNLTDTQYTFQTDPQYAQPPTNSWYSSFTVSDVSYTRIYGGTPPSYSYLFTDSSLNTTSVTETWNILNTTSSGIWTLSPDNGIRTISQQLGFPNPDSSFTIPFDTFTPDVANVKYTPCAWFAIGSNSFVNTTSERVTSLVYSSNGIVWHSTSGVPDYVELTGEDRFIDFDASNHIWVLGRQQTTNTSDSTLMWSTNASEWYPAISGAPHVTNISDYNCRVTSVKYDNGIWLAGKELTTGGRNGQVVSDLSTIFRSTDGKTWEIVQQPVFNQITGFIYASNASQWIAYGTNSILDFYANGNAIGTLLSTNNGKNWGLTYGSNIDGVNAIKYSPSERVWISAGYNISGSYLGGNGTFIQSLVTARVVD